jgi:hypothetical protein
LNYREYEKSRNLFIVEIVCASVIGTLVSGVLLSGYLDYIGMSQKLNGIISAIPVIAMVFQPMGAMLGERTGNCKRFVITFAVVQRLLFATLYCLPIFLGAEIRVATLVLIFGCAHSFAALITPSATNWVMRITPEEERQRYFGRREIALVVTGAMMTLIMGFTIQYFTQAGSPERGYMILSGALLLFACVNIFCLVSIKAPPVSGAVPHKAGNTLLFPLRDVFFRRVIFGVCLYEFGTKCAIPFWNIHALNDLKLSYGYLTVLSVLVSFAKVCTLNLWTRKHRLRNWSQICVSAILAIAASHLLNAFAWDSIAKWYLPIPSFVGMVGWAFIGMGMLNFEYDNIGQTNQATYLGVVAVMSGVSGFAGTLLGGTIMDLADLWQLSIGGKIIMGQQLQMVFSFFILVCAALYIHYQCRRGHIQ